MYIKENLYNFLKIIPANRVVTYKDLSKLFITSPRYIAKLLSENDRKDVPCYKVVNSDKTIGGYNMGYNEKYKKIENDGIEIENGKIQDKYFRKIKTFNYFIAFPLDYENKEKFYKLQKDLKSNYGKKNIIYQNPNSPHITIKFLGDINIDDLKDLYESVRLYFQKEFELKGKELPLDVIDNFGGKIYFLTFDKLIKNSLKDYLKNFNNFVKLPKDDREYQPHLVILKYKGLKPLNEEKIKKIIRKHNIYIKLDTVRFYVAVNGIHQLPLIDIKL